MKARPFSASVADAQVNSLSGIVGKAEAGFQPDVDLGMGHLKPVDAGQQPFGRKGRAGRHVQNARARSAPQAVQPRGEMIEARTQIGQGGPRGIGRDQAAAAPPLTMEKGQTQPILESPYHLPDRRRGYAQFCRRK